MDTSNRAAVFLAPGEGRSYPMGRISAQDDVFYVLEGTMSFLIGDRWLDAPRGSFVLAPSGVTHDFENRGAVRAGILNFSARGNFEQHMPGIAEWFINNPPGQAGCRALRRPL